MVELFEKHVKTLGKHIKDALKEELNRSVVASFATTASINDIRQMQKEGYLMNAVTENKHGYMIKAIFSASPTNMQLAEALQWDYDPSQITIPTFFVSSTGNGDENLVVSATQLQEIYDAVPDTVTKVMARRKDADHGDMLSVADGYMTAWFRWLLQGDDEAATAFIGNNAELMRNNLYQDQRVNITK